MRITVQTAKHQTPDELKSLRVQDITATTKELTITFESPLARARLSCTLQEWDRITRAAANQLGQVPTLPFSA